MEKNNNLFWAAIFFGIFYFPIAAFFYGFSGKCLTYASNRLYGVLITLRHGDWYEDRLKRTIGHLRIGSHTSVLEVGCGPGQFSKRLLGAGAKLKAIDINKKFILKLQKRHGDTFELCSVLDLKYKDNSFDRIVLFDVLHHIPEYMKAVSEMHRVLKPGGYAIIWEGSETAGEEKMPPKIRHAMMLIFDGRTNVVDIDALKKKFKIEEIEPYCYKMSK